MEQRANGSMDGRWWDKRIMATGSADDIRRYIWTDTDMRMLSLMMQEGKVRHIQCVEV